MSRTTRTVPKNSRGVTYYMRRPRYRWKLLAGWSTKHFTTDHDDKPVAARKEQWHMKKLA